MIISKYKNENKSCLGGDNLKVGILSRVEFDGEFNGAIRFSLSFTNRELRTSKVSKNPHWAIVNHITFTALACLT